MVCLSHSTCHYICDISDRAHASRAYGKPTWYIYAQVWYNVVLLAYYPTMQRYMTRYVNPPMPNAMSRQHVADM